MNISHTSSHSPFGPRAPNYIPPTPDAPAYVPRTPSQAHAQAQAQTRLETGFVREAVKPRGNARALKRLAQQRQSRETCEKMKEPLLAARFSKTEHPADAFCFLLTPSEQSMLLIGTGSTTDELQAFQSMVSGKPFSLKDAQAFAVNWRQLPVPHAKSLTDLPGYALLDQQATALAGAAQRMNFVHSTVDFKTQTPQPEYDLGALVKPGDEDGVGPKPEVAGILNPASRSGWGKGGASKAIQDGARGTAFQRLQKALYKGRTNPVGNAPVGQACVVPLGEDKVVFSVAGPNHKHHTGLRIKLPRLSHLLKPDHVSKSQESKLRAAYRTFFTSVDQYNADAALAGQDAIQKLHMVPISANVFGFPKDKAASIMAEEILRYTAQNPDIKVQVLAVNDDVLAGHVRTAFISVGARCTTESGISKQA